MKQPKVGIVILSWNNAAETLACLTSLQDVTYENFYVILVDNASNDKTVRIVGNNFPNVEIVKNSKNYGYAKGVNIGITAARKHNPEYILLLNNDTTVAKDFLSVMINVIEKGKPCIAGPIIYHKKFPERIWFAGGILDYIHGPFLHRHKVEDNDAIKPYFSVDYVNGCCMLLPIEIIEKIGLLDEDYGSYVEDVDYNVRAKSAGYKSVIIPKASVWHTISASTGGEGNYRKEYLKAKNAFIFGYKNIDKQERTDYMLNLSKIKLKESIDMLIAMRFRSLLSVIGGYMAGLVWGFYPMTFR